MNILLRIFAFAAALATAGFLYTQTMQNRQSSASFDAVSSAVLQSIDLTDMQEADAQMVRRLYGFAPSEMDGCLLYYPATNMGHGSCCSSSSPISRSRRPFLTPFRPAGRRR